MVFNQKFLLLKLVRYYRNIVDEGDDIGEPCKMGIPRERKARREQIIAYPDRIKMCSRPQTARVTKVIVVRNTIFGGSSPSTPAKQKIKGE